MQNTSIIRQRIDDGNLSPLIMVIIGIGFLLNLVDGFDVIAISVSAPSLSAEWGISRADLGPIFSAALIGMAIGAAIISPFADRFGRRRMLLFSAVLVGLCMIATGLIPKSIPLLLTLRFLTGVGVGVILASGAAIASEFAPERYRNLAVALTILGYPFGAMLVGPVANIIIPSQGWEMLFICGGVLTLAMGLVIYFILPESIEFLALNAKKDGKNLGIINSILLRLGRPPIEELTNSETDKPTHSGKLSGLFADNRLQLDTICLWTIFFSVLLSLYFLFSWIPTLFVDSGFELNQGITALTYFNTGAIFGTLIIIYLITRGRLAFWIGIYLLGAGTLLTVLYLTQLETLQGLNLIIFAIGFCIQAAFTACYSLAARVYPTEVRTTGIGWSAGLGRIGGIASPILAGLLISVGWNMYDLFILFAIPMFVAAALTWRFKM